MTIDTVVGETVTRIEAIHAAREQALSMSRALVRQCANAIRAVHRAEFEDAEQQLRDGHVIAPPNGNAWDSLDAAWRVDATHPQAQVLTARLFDALGGLAEQGLRNGDAGTARVAFENVNPRLEYVARTLGAGPWRVFRTITLPLAARGVIAGALLAFARALGEFGATIMVAGFIPGETATLSLSIYHLVQLGRDTEALALLGISLGIALGAVWLGERFLRRHAA